MANSSLLPAATLVLCFLGLAVAENNVLFSGQALMTEDRLTYGDFNFIMQSDCNLVLYNGGWQSNTANNGEHCKLALLDDGRLQIYDSATGKEVWSSEVMGSRTGEYVAALHPDGKIVVYGPAVWRTGKNGYAAVTTPVGMKKTPELKNTPLVSNMLLSGQILYAQGELTDRNYHFVMQGDCNLVLYNGGWQSNTHGNGDDCFLRLDHFGGLTIMDDTYTTVWTNDIKSDRGEYVAVLKPEGEVVVYGPSIWSTTAGAADGRGGIKMVGV